MKRIYVGAGCFWGTQEYFRRLKGVENTEVGYGQGRKVSPTYQEVCRGDTGHAELVLVDFDEHIISLDKIVDHFMRIVDPTSLNKQGNDIGVQYRCGLYSENQADIQILQSYVNSYQVHYDKPLVVEVEVLRNFYPAEDYHQDYLVKNPTGYCHVDFSKIQNDELK